MNRFAGSSGLIRLGSVGGFCRSTARYSFLVATTLDRDKLHDVFDQAIIVIDEKDLERSRRDPRVRALHESGAKLRAELEAEGANYD